MSEQDRPILVWLILIYSAFASVAWVYSASSVASSMTTFDYMAGIVSVLFYLIAAITLFLMRKMAIYLFVGAVCLELALFIWGYGSRIEVMMLGGDLETIMEMISVAISVVICVYSFLMAQSGRMR